MKMATSLAWLSMVLLLAGCAAFTTGTQVQSGRRALLVNDPERALPYFLEAAQSDPNYVYRSVDFHEGIWTYVGRAQYATKRYAEARQSLERALSLDATDLLARLYFGLTLTRSGDDARGAKEILAGMKGIYDFIDYMNRTRPIQAFWDPLGEIRKAIEVYLLRAPGSDLVRSDSLIADAEWLGNKMEDEIERVRQDEQRWYQRDFDHRSGGSIGFGIGF
jgi:tetratricopeptide (TPR) repeat protein